jgi:hypothetical protein
MKKKFLLVILAAVVVTVVFICAACQEVTQADIDQQLSRWWVIYYKMMENNTPMSGLVERPNGVDGILDSEFGVDFLGKWDDQSIKDKYHYVQRRNELMEEVLVKLKGTEALKEIDNVWSLDEVPELWEKVNNE